MDWLVLISIGAIDLLRYLYKRWMFDIKRKRRRDFWIFNQIKFVMAGRTVHLRQFKQALQLNEESIVRITGQTRLKSNRSK